nr:hypothetical protein [Tsukamurella tyrosinosolvens]
MLTSTDHRSMNCLRNGQQPGITQLEFRMNVRYSFDRTAEPPFSSDATVASEDSAATAAETEPATAALRAASTARLRRRVTTRAHPARAATTSTSPTVKPVQGKVASFATVAKSSAALGGLLRDRLQPRHVHPGRLPA